MADELIGADLGGRYQVEKKIADTMLGRVYSARSLADGRLYHVKVPYANVSGNAEKAERFRRELEAMARIDSPHTLQVLDTGIHDSIAFLVLEYLAATPLSVVLDQGAMRPGRVAGIVSQIAMACKAAHAAGIVHRNLSPQTVLLLDNAKERDFIKVSDFGLSRIVDAEAEEAGGVLTQAGTRIGNVLYMAPEYIEQDEVSPAGDMYGLGALTYHLLTGRPPFEGKAADVLTRHVTDEPPRPSAVVGGLPAWCDELVVKLMAKDPARRPSADRVIGALGEQLGGLNAPKLLAIDADGKVIRKSRVPVWIAVAGLVVLMSGAMFAGLGAAGVTALWFVSQASQFVPESGDLTPTAASLEVAPSPAPAAVATEPTPPPKARGARPSPTPPRPEPTADAPAPTRPGPVTMASLRVGADQRALVHVDDIPVGYTPLELALSPGKHVVSATLPSRSDSKQQRVVVAEAGSPVTLDFDF